MRLDTSQTARLEQRMKLAPRMIQAMEILQLPLLALQERIEAELVSNPVLETGQESDEPAARAEETPEASEERALVVKDESDQAEDFSRLEAFDKEFEPDIWGGDAARSTPRESGERDKKLDAMANTPAPSQSLVEYLLDQWAFVEAPDEVRYAGQLLIEHIDDDGYLREKLEILLAKSSQPITLEHLKTALSMVQRLDPVGVGARDLKECLLLQLALKKEAGQDVELQVELVRSFLHDIEMNRLPHIARKTSQSVERVKAAIEELGRLNPRPGSLIGERPAPAIQPDILVELDENGEPVISMSDGELPTLHISRMYRKMSRGGTLDTQAKEFLQRNIRSAQWLIEAIQQRRHTVRRVAEEVFKVQKEFFEQGAAALKSLPMADVAQKVGVHIATISRAVAGKYVQTPRGIFPLRMFFSGGTTSQSGEDLAWDAVRAKLQEVIDAEDKANPLNDDELVAELKKRGIVVARRTIAKYRGLMDIPPARQRKKF